MQTSLGNIQTHGMIYNINQYWYCENKKKIIIHNKRTDSVIVSFGKVKYISRLVLKITEVQTLGELRMSSIANGWAGLLVYPRSPAISSRRI